ncbi:MAG: phosphoribosyltransferase [bacterium]|nr:phosphoribosyltransferase [bacterium]
MLFLDRVDAGRRLARRLARAGLPDPVVLAIPRGGVVVAAEVARELDAPLDLVIPRKIGAPHNEELAVGAVGPDGSLHLDQDLVKALALTPAYLEEEARRQVQEITRRMSRYRGDRPYPDLAGKTVIVVDDGVATGSTVTAALTGLRARHPARLVLAVPVAPRDTLQRLAAEADEVFCLATPEPFHAVGQFYQSFGQTSDEEVVRLLADNPAPG